MSRKSWLLMAVLSLGLVSTGLTAAPSAGGDVDVIDWKLAQKRMKMLSQLGFHPFLMPLIMENRDMLELSKEQVRAFMDWRNKNRVPLLATMNQILRARNDFLRISLSPDVSDEVLMAKQEEIFRLHRKVLRYQLSCRRNILDNFNEEQWDNFRFVLTENGYEVDAN